MKLNNIISFNNTLIYFVNTTLIWKHTIILISLSASIIYTVHYLWFQHRHYLCVHTIDLVSISAVIIYTVHYIMMLTQALFMRTYDRLGFPERGYNTHKSFISLICLMTTVHLYRMYKCTTLPPLNNQINFSRNLKNLFQELVIL